MDSRPAVRCVIYTRTSSDECLGQDYNSLAAQRDACAAFILSQKSEGWSKARMIYEDGGYSGGSLDRPALRQLLTDMAAGELDVVVVYKIDRLTRSLRDFAKLSELLGRSSASFVAVTQQFNTASSMGRLTLNILLTFAQFEREMAGDRIRDKIAASTKLGIWMGGHPALGYDAPAKRLVVNPHEADIVRHIFKRFLDLQSMGELRKDLERSGIVSKRRIIRNGPEVGGNSFTWHPLHSILTNPLYAGMIRHKGQIYKGRHVAIIDPSQFEKVQEVVRRVAEQEKAKRDKAYPSLLRGIIFDMGGERICPFHTNKATKRYRYYVTSSLISRVTRRKLKNHRYKMRFPALELDKFVVGLLSRHLRDRDWVTSNVPTASRLHATLRGAQALASELEGQLSRNTNLIRELVQRIEIDKTTIRLLLSRTWLYEHLDIRLPRGAPSFASSSIEVTFIGHNIRSGNDVKVVLERPGAPAASDHRLVREVLRAIRWFNELASGKHASIQELAGAESCCPTLITDRVRLAFLAPDIVEAILEGSQPTSMTVASLKRACPLPYSWEEQRKLLLDMRPAEGRTVETTPSFS